MDSKNNIALPIRPPILFLFVFLLLQSSAALTFPETALDVAIVGGGPSGLATAISLRRALGPSAKIRVFERATALREVGGTVGLLSMAFASLDKLDPTGELSTKVDRVGNYRKVLQRFDANGVLQDENHFNPDVPMERQVVVAWHKLQKVLAEQIPDGDICLGYGVESVKNVDGEEGVSLSFTNGEKCAAKILIGADGIMSKVRRTVLGDKDNNNELPEYAGSVIWRMILSGVNEKDLVDLESGTTKVWGSDGRVLVLEKIGTKVLVAGQSTWPEDRLHVLDCQYNSNSGSTLNEGKATATITAPKNTSLDRFLNEFRQYPENVLKMISMKCDVSNLLEHPIHFRPAGTPWGRFRVTLVGDAAHGMPPNSAMGVPMALEDAVELGHAVANHGCTSEALRSYEKEREHRVNVIASTCIKQSTDYYKEKDDEANPFIFEENFIDFIKNFSQDPVPQAD